MNTSKVTGHRNTRVCPVCESKLGSAATKCLVCGAELPEDTITGDESIVHSTATNSPKYDSGASSSSSGYFNGFRWCGTFVGVFWKQSIC